jgi:hypothetical protein
MRNTFDERKLWGTQTLKLYREDGERESDNSFIVRTAQKYRIRFFFQFDGQAPVQLSSELLLEFLKFAITMIVYPAPIMDC